MGKGHAPAASGLWPADRLFVGYLLAVAALVLICSNQVPGAGWLLSLHAAGILLLLLKARTKARSRWASIFGHWYPLLYVAFCYHEMSILIPALRRVEFDAQMARLDYALWGVHPTVFLERVHQAWLSEWLQIVYALHVPAILLIAWLLWRKRRFAGFRYYAFLISLGFLVSFAGYLAVPVRGPRFLLAPLQHVELRGLWSFSAVRRALDVLESRHYDCFPSGHAEVVLLSWWSVRRISRGLFAGYSAYAACMLFSTVYLRYHYTVDVAAGLFVAAVLLVVTPGLYQRMSPMRGEEPCVD